MGKESRERRDAGKFKIKEGEKGIEKSELVGEMGNNTRVWREGKVEKGKEGWWPTSGGVCEGGEMFEKREVI